MRRKARSNDRVVFLSLSPEKRPKNKRGHAMFPKILIASVASLALIVPLAMPAQSDARPAHVNHSAHHNGHRHGYRHGHRAPTASTIAMARRVVLRRLIRLPHRRPPRIHDHADPRLSNGHSLKPLCLALGPCVRRARAFLLYAASARIISMNRIDSSFWARNASVGNPRCLSTEGAETNQPRATPWESEGKLAKAPKGRGKETKHLTRAQGVALG